MYVNPIIRALYTNYQNRNQRSSMTKPNFQKVTFRGDVQFFDYDARLKAKLDARSGWAKFWHMGKKKAKDEVNHELLGFNLNREGIIRAKEQLLREKDEILRQKQEIVKALEEKNEILEQRLEEAKRNNEKDKVIISLQRQLDDVKRQQIKNKEDLKTETVKLDRLKKAQEVLTKREAGKGWDKIAGYEGLKGQMEEVFINKLAIEKSDNGEINFPNGILLYGQSGTGKTRFAEAFAEQTGCEFVKIDTMQENSDIITDIISAMRNASKIYGSKETPKKRTIILLDDFNFISQLSPAEKKKIKKGSIDFSDTDVGQLAFLLKNCASKYKTTIFMTTNYPKKIESKLLNPAIVPYQIFLGPPKPVDAAKIFQYHTKDYTKQDIDYNKLGNMVARAIENDEAYSAQGIVNVVNYAKEKAGQSQLTESGLLKAIKSVKPDISKEEFNAFLDEMSDTLNEYVKNSKGGK